MEPIDPRGAANTIIKLANANGRIITNLSLQKILYFVHGRYLSQNGKPLVSGYFEAWKYGPVHPLVYETFKDFGPRQITDLAKKRNLMTGREHEVEEPESSHIKSFIMESASPYLRMDVGRLVDLSHARNSPWDILTRQNSSERIFGMRITDQSIRDGFKFHKIAIYDVPMSGEPNEESPPY